MIPHYVNIVYWFQQQSGESQSWSSWLRQTKELVYFMTFHLK